MIPRLPSYPMPQPSAFPGNRAAWTPDPQRAALLVHDLQSYFLNFYDTTQPPIPDLIRHVQALLDHARRAGIPVVYTAQPGDQTPADRALLTDFWGPGLRAEDAQTRIHPAVAPQPGDTVLTKWRYSAFKRSALEEQLRAWGRDQLLICGVYAHIGCLLTAAEAFMLDIQAFLIGDALADFSEADHLQALRYGAARCAQVTGTAALLSALTPAGAGQWTPERLRAELARHVDLDPAELHDDDDLLALGLDSIRLMVLVDTWQADGLPVTYVDVAAAPTLRGLLERIGAGAPA